MFCKASFTPAVASYYHGTRLINVAHLRRGYATLGATRDAGTSVGQGDRKKVEGNII